MFVYPEIQSEYDLIQKNLKEGSRPDDLLQRLQKLLEDSWAIFNAGEESESWLFAELQMLAGEYCKFLSKEEALTLTRQWKAEFDQNPMSKIREVNYGVRKKLDYGKPPSHLRTSESCTSCKYGVWECDDNDYGECNHPEHPHYFEDGWNESVCNDYLKEQD